MHREMQTVQAKYASLYESKSEPNRGKTMITNDTNTKNELDEYCFNPDHLKPGILALRKQDCKLCMMH
jgi:hypothetical protein